MLAAVVLALVCSESTSHTELTTGLSKLKAADHAAAVKHLEKALWWNPAMTEAYRPLSQAYEQLGDLDLAIYYAHLDLDLLRREDKPDQKAIKAYVERIREFRPDGAAAEADQAALVEDMAGLAGDYIGKKKYQAAAFWLSQLAEIDPTAKAISSLQKKIAKKTKGGAALRLRKKLAEKSESWIARSDKAHSDWGKAYNERTPERHYKVKTNVGYDLFQKVYWSMDQMHDFYRETFGYDGGDPPVLNLQIHATREGFAKTTSVGAATRGYYNSSEIVTYDLQVDGFDADMVYRTLFHEASHQFIDLITNSKPPMYLNEGVSSYFEGANIQDDGTVRTNEVPPNRLNGVARTLDTPREVKLETLLRAEKAEYDATYYCYGWALMYFLLNWEDESFQTPYRQPLMDLLGKYKKGGKHDVVERFESTVLAPVKGPQSLAELQPVWRAWMDALIKEYRQGAAAAPSWIKRARNYLANDRLARAEEASGRVLTWFPAHPEALLLLDDTYRAMQDEDRALASLFRARLGCESEAQLKQVEERLPQVDPLLTERQEFEGKAHGATLDRIAELRQSELNRSGLLEIAHQTAAIAPTTQLLQAKAEINAEGFSLGRRYSLWNGDDFSNWSGQRDLAMVDNPSFEFDATEGENKSLRAHRRLTPPFTMTVETELPESENAYFGLIYGYRSGVQGHYIAFDLEDDFVVDGHYEFIETPVSMVLQPVEDDVKPATATLGDGPIRLVVTDRAVDLFVDDKKVFSKQLEEGLTSGQVGLILEKGNFRIHKVEIEE